MPARAVLPAGAAASTREDRVGHQLRVGLLHGVARVTTTCSARGLSAGQPRWFRTLLRMPRRSLANSAPAISASEYSLLITVTGMSPTGRRAAQASFSTCS